ncbi:hypothetical protein [Trinickia symbiotica]|nr:hypothetical protein [Trinickia symbiotica]
MGYVGELLAPSADLKALQLGWDGVKALGLGETAYNAVSRYADLTGARLSIVGDEAGSTTLSDQIKATATDGIGASAEPVSKLEVVTYRESVERAVAGDNLTGDHIPSIAAIRTHVENTLGLPLTRAQATALRAETNTLIVDGDFHASGRTYFSNNTPAQVAADAQDLQAAAFRDQAVYMQNAEKFGYNREDLQGAAFNVLNERNSGLFGQLSTKDGIKQFFTNLGAWEPE